MTPELYRRAKRVFFEICDAGPEQRRAVLETLDATLRHEVEALLRLEDDEALLRTGGAGDVVELADGAPERIGSYRLIRRIGFGGMGVTYEAEQDFPRRRVALKLVRAGWLSSAARHRFRREAEALGRLQHPAVAQLYEAGQADTGRGVEHYIAMELVRGEAIDTYVRRHGLGTRAVIELFCEVCRGVEAAHAVGVVHRDLKPANILVDQVGRVKIVDFGVAQFTDPAHGATALTTTGQIVGTLAYMSPEQVRTGGRRIDARADIYALGATLFELLSGRPPVDLAGLSPPEALRKLDDAEPRRLGTVDTRLRGDLDTIVAKTLEHDPQRRYASAAELRADLERYLRSEPIRARPASLAYRVRKFASRHRGLVASAAALFAVLATALVVTTLFWQRAERARAQAQAALDRSERLLTFFREDLLGGLDAGRFGYDAKLIDLLDDAAGRIDRRFAGQPALAGAMHQEVADMYASLGRTAAEIRHAEAAHTLLREAFGPDARDTIVAELRLAEARADAQKLEAYLAHAKDAAARALRSYGPYDWLTLKAQVTQADALQMLGRYDEAERILRPAIAGYRQHFGPDETGLYRGLNILGALLLAQKRYADAEPVIAEELAGARRLRPAGHPQIVSALNNYARVLIPLHRPAEAEPLLREAIEQASISFSPQHWRVAIIRGNLASVLNSLGRYDEALGQTRLALASLHAGFDDPTVYELQTLSQKVRAHLGLEQWEQAAATIGELLEAAIRMRADLAPAVRVLELACDPLIEHGQAAALAALCRRAREPMKPSEDSFVRAAMLEARCLTKLGRGDEARALLDALHRPQDATLAEQLEAQRAAGP